MRKFGAIAATILALGLAGTAQAVPVSGSLSFSDGGITVPPVPSLSIVSALNTITQGTPIVNACTGSFTSGGGGLCDLAGAVTAGTVNLLAPAGTIYTYGGFTFTIASTGVPIRTPLAVGVGGLGTDSLDFLFAGTVDDGPGGLDPTVYAGVWTGNGVCTGTAGPPAMCTANQSASYSASIVAATPPGVPEPASLALLGTALVGFGFLARRRSRRSHDAAAA